MARGAARTGGKGGPARGISAQRHRVQFCARRRTCARRGVVALAGVGIAFLINAASFVGVILVILRWKRPVVKRATPPETMAGATRAAIRYVRYSPGVRRVLLRSGTGMFFASALLALLPSLA